MIGMVQHAQGMFNATVVAAEVPNQNTRQFGTQVFHIFSCCVTSFWLSQPLTIAKFFKS
jgi:hypothetical protein